MRTRNQLSPWAQAFLALTLETISPGDPRIREIYSDLESERHPHRERHTLGGPWRESQFGNAGFHHGCRNLRSGAARPGLAHHPRSGALFDGRPWRGWRLGFNL